MKIYCKELDKSFENKEQLFKALADNDKFIIDAKKSQVYKSFEKGLQVVTDQSSISKAFNDETKGIKFDNDYYYFVVNSANILDSHGDMHVDGNWNKSVKDQQGKVYLVFDHSLKRNDIIAMPKDIEMLTAKVPFSLLGKNYEGESYSLIYKVAKDKIIDQTAKDWLEKGYDLQASVRMQYVKIETALNSTNPDYSKQKTIFDEYFPLIANKNDFNEEIDYFWVVKEAKNIMESSLVLFGSNQATGEISNNNKSEAENITPEKTEPSNDTQKIEELKRIINKI
jgi:hypothetical protein